MLKLANLYNEAGLFNFLKLNVLNKESHSPCNWPLWQACKGDHFPIWRNVGVGYHWLPPLTLVLEGQGKPG